MTRYSTNTIARCTGSADLRPTTSSESSAAAGYQSLEIESKSCARGAPESHCGWARRQPPSRRGGAAHNDVRLSRSGLSSHVEPALRQRVVFSGPSTFVQTPRHSFALRPRRSGPRPEATVVDDQGPLVVPKPLAKLFEQRRIPSSHDDQSSGSLHRRRTHARGVPRGTNAGVTGIYALAATSKRTICERFDGAWWSGSDHSFLCEHRPRSDRRLTLTAPTSTTRRPRRSRAGWRHEHPCTGRRPDHRALPGSCRARRL